MSGTTDSTGEAKTWAARQYLSAVEAANKGDWQRALPALRALVTANPELPHVHHLLSVAALVTGSLDEALAHSQRALELKPGDAEFLLQSARAISQARSPQQALAVAHEAVPLAWSDAAACQQLSAIFARANAYEAASRMSARALELSPGDTRNVFNHATTSLFNGDFPAAEAAYRQVLAREPAHAQAHLGLAQLRKWTPEENNIQRLTTSLERTQDAVGRMYLHLALGKEYEDIGNYAIAFRHFTAGKTAGKGLLRFGAQADQACFDALAMESGDRRGAGGCPSEEPIFVVGMPRTGTTLVDRILSSHSSVQSIGEVLNFPSLVKRASGSRTPRLIDADTVRAARRIDWAMLGEEYIGSTRPLTGSFSRFVDKHPHNFLYLEMIARALPAARIIGMRRNPMDTCLSNFRQLFSPASPYHGYSFDLIETGRYFVRFNRLMQHFERLLGERILWIDYEDLVADQERQTRRLLDFCGLDWQPQCLRFELNDAPVATASAAQVRGTLHRDAQDRWRHYADDLQPLMSLLHAQGMGAPVRQP
nr:sulfotransferase [uncultured Pseudoxanthomonas sp.]